jgi:hypothetical protein
MLDEMVRELTDRQHEDQIEKELERGDVTVCPARFADHDDLLLGAKSYPVESSRTVVSAAPELHAVGFFHHGRFAQQDRAIRIPILRNGAALTALRGTGATGLESAYVRLVVGIPQPALLQFVDQVICAVQDVRFHESLRSLGRVLAQRLEEDGVLLLRGGDVAFDGGVEAVGKVRDDGAQEARKARRVRGQVDLAVERVAEGGDTFRVALGNGLLVLLKDAFELDDLLGCDVRRPAAPVPRRGRARLAS